MHRSNILNLALDGKDKTRLSNLKAELDKLRKAKEEYVKEHPEHRKLVYGESSAKKPRENDESGIKPAGGAVRQLFGKDGLPLHPERSTYYDPVLNPYGVPPPGMPYMEKRTCGVPCCVARLKSYISNASGRNGGG
jgi:mRNA biogenesis factor